MKYDDTLGQNMLVGVEASYDNNEYKLLTKELVTVSDEAMFEFLNKDFGFIISKPNLCKDNDIYYGIHVTYDGGKTFNSSKIYYNNLDIQIITILDVPYYEDNLLKLPCSIYQIKEDDSDYEDVNIIFTSYDNGLSWVTDSNIEFYIKNGSLTSNGATFIMKNNTREEYYYGPEYSIEKYDNNEWVMVAPNESLSWIDVIYNLKANEEIELNYNWLDISELSSGKYRIVKSLSQDDKKIKLYAEFSI